MPGGKGDGGGGGGELLRIFVGGLQLGSPNPDPISDQDTSFSSPFLDIPSKIRGF